MVATQLPRGTCCLLDGSEIVQVYPHIVIGVEWDGSYRAVVGSEWLTRIDRSRLEILTEDMLAVAEPPRPIGRGGKPQAAGRSITRAHVADAVFGGDEVRS